MHDELTRRIVEIAADIFECRAADLTSESTPEVVESWDSVAQLNLMMALEDEFGIELLPSDVDRMTSLGAVVELVSSRSA
jgi:acyl carrier protein